MAHEKARAEEKARKEAQQAALLAEFKRNQLKAKNKRFKHAVLKLAMMICGVFLAVIVFRFKQASESE